MSRYQGLGRGLGALIPTGSSDTARRSETNQSIHEIPISKISANPKQPRRNIDPGELKRLIDSIKKHGVLQPVVVTPTGNGYQLIAGERRYQASKLLGLKTMPAVVRAAEELEQLELALVENIQREDLNAIDRGLAYQRLTEEFQLTQEGVAEKVGQSRSQVANTLRLLQLPEEIKNAIIKNTISEGHAKALLSLGSEQEQLRLFKEIVSKKLTTRQTEQFAQKVNVKAHRRSPSLDPALAEQRDHLSQKLGTKVEIAQRKGRGRITIEFYSAEELRQLLDTLTN
ncbi:MAG: ParB/RepB/Spo0J family partition protein [bacterium]|nr:ParB/RepB/Spo0J family partition protein [bacterium]